MAQQQSMRMFWLAAALALICYGTGYTQTKDYKFQSLYILNFAKNTEWPASAQKEEIVIGVFDNQKVTNEFIANIGSRSVGAKKFNIKNLATINDISDCHILFVPISNKNNIKQIVQKVASAACLIITEKEGWIKQGSIINFVITDEGKMKFELNNEAAQAHNLKISSTITTIAINK